MAEAIITKVQAYFDARDKSKPSLVPHVFKFVLTRNGATFATYVFDLKNWVISKNASAAAEVTLTLSEELLQQLFTNKADATEAINSGLATVEGDRELLKKLKPFVQKMLAA